MGIFKANIISLKKNFREISSFLFSMVMSFFIIFIFFYICKNPAMQIDGEQGFIKEALSIGFIVASITFIFYANKVFIDNKRPELVLQAMTGSSPNDIAKFMLYQTFTISIAGLIIGIGVGVIALPIINYLISIIFNITATTGSIVPALKLTGLIAILEVAYVIILDWAYAYMQEFRDWIVEEKDKVVCTNKKVKMGIPGIIVYLLGASVFIFYNEIVKGFLGTAMMIYVFLLVGIIQFYSKTVIRIINGIRSRKSMIFKSVFAYSFSSSSFLYSIISAIIILYGMIFMSESSEPLMLYSYGSLNVFLAIALIYKFIQESKIMNESYRDLITLGVTRKQIRKVIGKEVFTSVAIITFVNVLSLSIISVPLLRNGDIGLYVYLVTMLVTLVPFTLSAVIISYLYKRNLMKFVGR